MNLPDTPGDLMVRSDESPQISAPNPFLLLLFAGSNNSTIGHTYVIASEVVFLNHLLFVQSTQDRGSETWGSHIASDLRSTCLLQ
jgi:hypothetical protein